MIAARVLPHLLSPLALGDVHEHVYRPEQVTGVINDRVSVGQDGETLAIRALDDDLVPVIGLAHFQCQGHPALVMSDRGAVRQQELKRAAEAVHGVV